MTLPPGAWAPIYAIQLFLPSLALACLGVHQPRMLAGSRLSRFLVGFCITPFVLGVWMLIVAAVLPGSPRWLFLLPPSCIAVALLVVYGPRTARRMVRGCERTRRSSRPSWLIYVSYTGALVVLAIVVYKLAINSRPPVVTHDALIYLGEALAFAQQRSIDAATTFRGWASGTTMGSTHNFVFPAYLSHALMTTGNNPLGYPYDYAVRAAFQATFVYMALSVVALGGIVRYPGTGALALLLTLPAPQMGLITSVVSRDAFRIIPLLLLAVVLAHLPPQRLRRRIPLVRLMPPLILATFAISGHTLGGIVTVTLVLAWVVWAIVGKAHWLNVLLVTGVIGVGMLAGGFHYLNTYIETGRLSGYVTTDYAVYNTPLENVLRQQDPLRLAEETALLRRLGILLERAGYGLPIIALAAAVLALAGWSRYSQDRRVRSIPFIGLMVLTGLLPFFGVLDFGYPFSASFVMNPRYALHWHPFAGVCIAVVVGYWFLNFKSLPGRCLRTLGVISLVLLTLGATGVSAFEIVNWPTINASEEYLHDRIDTLRLVTRSLPAGKRLLLADDRYNYYLDNQAVAMYTRPTWEIIQAKNEGEVRNALAKMNIGAVALDRAEIRDWWDQIPLYAYLNNPDHAVWVADGVFSVYRLVESAAERDRLLDKTLREVNDDTPASYVVRAIDSGYLNGYENRFLPYKWQGPGTITMRELAEVAPPLTRLGGRGDFTFSRVSSGRDNAIRVAPDPRGTATNETVIFFGIQTDDRDGLHIGPGQTAVLSLSARFSDSAAKAAIRIEDRTPNWKISETQMSGSTWQHYVVVRKIRPDATTAILGVRWQPSGAGQWLEIADMQVFIVPAQMEAEPEEIDGGGSDTP